MSTMTNAAKDVLAERRRQIEVEGFSTEHDDQHKDSELAAAAVCYVARRCRGKIWWSKIVEAYWPWDLDWWKPTDRRMDLVKAGALIIAEIERLDRQSAAGAKDYEQMMASYKETES